MGKNSNISDEDILKEETQPGVVVYRSNVPEGAGVFDMDIAPGIKEVTIKYDLLMLGCEKSFPDVEKLIIGEDVVSIEILNTLFPNVRWVLSMNYEFETGSYRLQEKNWNIALAYMLEEGNGKTKDALVI